MEFRIPHEIGESLGRKITSQRLDPSAPGDAAKPLWPMFDHHDGIGLRGNALTLHAILGHEPRSLRGFQGTDQGRRRQKPP
ncbi:MAG TPA: hypothetical protein VGC09_10700 [Rhodopila sp.]